MFSRALGTYRFVTQTFGTQTHKLALPVDITPAERQRFAAALYAAIVNQPADAADVGSATDPAPTIDHERDCGA